MLLAVLLDFILPLSGLLYDNLYAKSEPGWRLEGVWRILSFDGDRFLRSHSQPSWEFEKSRVLARLGVFGRWDISYVFTDMGKYLWKIASDLVPGHEYWIPIIYLPQFMQKRREYHGGSDVMPKLDANSLYPKSDINKYPHLIILVALRCVL